MEILINLSEEEEALIMGTLLGDAHLQKTGNSYRLKIEHSIKQKSYVEWKHKKLQRLCTTTQSPKIVESKKKDETIVFYLSAAAWLKKYHELFYQAEEGKYVKKITQKLIDNLPLNPMVLAAFYMDDGSVRDDCFAGKLATQGYSKDESELLCQYLKKFKIVGNVVAHLKSKNQYYISLPAATFGTFVKLIEPIVKEIPDMMYKLKNPNKPRND